MKTLLTILLGTVLSFGTRACETIYIHMYDTYGDGWNGGSMTIYNWASVVVWNGTMPNGSQATYNTCLEAGYYTVSVSGGTFPSEISWSIDDGMSWLASGFAPFNTAFTLVIAGCTDDIACNYNPSAATDDGSCCYYNCLKFELWDAEGNGWDATLGLRNNVGEIIFTTTLEDGYYGETYGCYDIAGCLRYVYTLGSHPYIWDGGAFTMYYKSSYLQNWTEVSSSEDIDDFPFTCSSGCTTPGAANYSTWNWTPSGICCFENFGVVVLQSYADYAWDGAEFRIRNGIGELVYHGSMLPDVYNVGVIFQLCLPDGCYSIEVDPSADNDPYGGYWTLGIDGVGLGGYMGQTHVFAVGEIIDGCMEPEANNYDPNANCNDACAYTCTSDLDMNGVVNVGDLLIFTSEFGAVCGQ